MSLCTQVSMSHRTELCGAAAFGPLASCTLVVSDPYSILEVLRIAAGTKAWTTCDKAPFGLHEWTYSVN